MQELTSRFEALEIRVRALETKNRRLQASLALAIVCVAATAAIAAAAPHTLTGTSLILTDSSGHTRVKLDASALLFTSASGTKLANFWADPAKGAGLVFFDGQHANGRLGIGMWGKDVPGIGIENGSGDSIAWLGQEKYGSSLVLYDGAGKKRLSGEAGKDTDDFNVFGPDGNIRAQLYVDSEKAGVAVRDASGAQRWHAYVSDAAHMKLFDSSGAVEWSQP